MHADAACELARLHLLQATRIKVRQTGRGCRSRATVRRRDRREALRGAAYDVALAARKLIRFGAPGADDEIADAVPIDVTRDSPGRPLPRRHATVHAARTV